MCTCEMRKEQKSKKNWNKFLLISFNFVNGISVKNPQVLLWSCPQVQCDPEEGRTSYPGVIYQHDLPVESNLDPGTNIACKHQHSILLAFSFQKNSSSLPSFVTFQVCDWVACLRPPIPPAETNLQITNWFGAPVPFNGNATYVCARGMLFENDPAQESVVYTCQVPVHTCSRECGVHLSGNKVVTFSYLLRIVWVTTCQVTEACNIIILDQQSVVYTCQVTVACTIQWECHLCVCMPGGFSLKMTQLRRVWYTHVR